MKDDRYYCLGLSTIKGLGPIRMNKLINYFGDPLSIWEADKRELEYIIDSPVLARKIVQERESMDIPSLVKKIAEKKIEFITLFDKEYPALLKNISDPPPVLYYKGKLIFNYPAISIVGARRCTNYGKKIGERIGCELAERGITVISGLARGIDTYGHIGALKGGGRTIAVLGCGLDIIYPPENKKLYYEIQENGTIVSEYPPGTEPLRGNFPQRNRIISGLSLGVLVIEAARRSGSLITAEIALEQGRKLFAIPGNIDRPQSKGTNELIKDGAKMVIKVEDIIEELFLNKNSTELFKGNNQVENSLKPQFPELTNEEKEVIKLFENEIELTVDEIIRLTDKRPELINTVLLKLELKGIISRGAGKKYSFMGLQSLLKSI